jgi:hypothetical protein
MPTTSKKVSFRRDSCSPGFGKENRREIAAVQYARENKVPFFGRYANGHYRAPLGVSLDDAIHRNERTYSLIRL